MGKKKELTPDQFIELFSSVIQYHKQNVGEDVPPTVAELYPDLSQHSLKDNKGNYLEYSIAWDMMRNCEVKKYLESKHQQPDPYKSLYRVRSEQINKKKPTIKIDEVQYKALLLYIGKVDIPPKYTTKKYCAYFFSHIRYDVWDKGIVEMHYTAENSGIVSGYGFYRGKDDAFKGSFEIRDNHICMDMQGHSNSNWFRLIGKVDGDKMHDAPYFRAAYVTISSYPNQYASAIEAIFVEETFATQNPKEVEKVKRYLMLQRHRFQSEILATNQLLRVSPSELRPNDLEGIIGSYACISRIGDQILVSSLEIDKIYRTTFKTKIYQKKGYEKNHQRCYFELIPGALNYVQIRGYLAAINTDEPNLQYLVSTLTIPMTSNDVDTPTQGTFHSPLELNGKEILWAGNCHLLKLEENVTVEPFICHEEELAKKLSGDYPRLPQRIHDKILASARELAL